ncbi:MAG: hypothetical protein JO019_03855 [Candidatus Kaiserbacteria bacterium]|nr:hypothetical protein [Candidatus Kaiserbacteria bacterium]
MLDCSDAVMDEEVEELQLIREHNLLHVLNAREFQIGRGLIVRLLNRGCMIDEGLMRLALWGLWEAKCLDVISECGIPELDTTVLCIDFLDLGYRLNRTGAIRRRRLTDEIQRYRERPRIRDF